MSLSPDASTVCTASADETLRFWKVFNTGQSRTK
jgi:WD40 repeat protein